MHDEKKIVQPHSQLDELEERNIALEDIRKNLEQTVRDKTKELQAVNEELLSSNEELKSANEELSAINERLSEALLLIKEQSETIIRQKDEQLNQVLDSSNDVIWSTDLTASGNSYISRSVERITGISVPEITNIFSTWSNFIHPDDKSIRQESLELLKHQNQVSCSYRVINKRGEEVWMREQIRIEFNSEGIPIRQLGIATDISSLKEAEKALIQERLMLRSVIDIIPDYIFVKDSKFRHIINNRAMVSLVGATSEHETLGKLTTDYFGSTGEKFLDDDERVFKSGIALSNKEENIINLKGEKIELLTTKVPLRDENGITVGIVGISRDITEYKNQEAILHQSEANLRTIFDHTEDSFTLLDHEYNIVMANSPARSVSPKFDVGVNILKIISDERREIFRKYLEQASHGDIVKYEVEYGKGQDSQWYSITIAAVKSDGRLIGYCITTHNLTAIKKAEISLRVSEERFHAFMDASPAIAWIKNSEGNYLYGNKTWNNLKENNMVASGFMLKNQKHELEIINGNQSVETIEFTKNNAGVKQYWNAIKFPIKNSTGDLLLGCFAIDISERKKYESELQQNQILLSRAYDIAEMGYWTYNPDTNHGNWNEQAKRIFGLEENFDTGFEGYLSTVHSEDLKKVKDAVALTLSNNKPYDIEYRIIRPIDGAIRWIHERTDFVPNDENSRLLLGVVQDITIRKKVEDILLEYNQRYEILSRATNDAIWDLDIEQDFELWNHGIQSIFGYSTTHITSAKQWRKDKIHPEDYGRVQLEITNAFDHRRTNWTSQYRYLCANGNYKYVLDRAYIIYNDNKPVRMIGAMQDITEQREFEQHIIATARELSELIENANTPIFGTDRNGYINEWNKVTASLTGHSKSEVLGEKLSRYMSPTQHKNLKIILNRVSSNKPVSDLQIPIRTKDNRELTILLNATPRRDTLKNITGILMVGQNITELIEYRQNLEVKVNERTLELNEALSKEKELVEIKSKFVSIASHEFRTPLSTISIVVGFLRKHRAKLNDDDFNVKLNAIEKQVNHMTYLLDDILMIGKTEAGKITAQHNPISIKDFFLQIAKEVEESAKTHTIDIKLMCSVAEFYSDEKLLRNIIINLLTNAIKFSPNAPSVVFGISNTAQYLRLTVEDKGIGISEEDLKNIFTSFHRGSNVGDIQGTGLGLSIAKKAVDLLHGTIQISSKMGEGTQFTVNLPLQQV